MNEDKVIKYKGYELISNLPKNEAFELFDTLIEKRYTTIKKYKDDDKCLVAKISTKKHINLMYKIPRQRNNRSWERFLTLFRDNEAFRNYKSMVELKTIDLKGTLPVLAAHKTSFGMSVDSFFVYNFVEGKPASFQELPLVLETLKILHFNGFTRSDPKLENFIIHKNDAYFIDFRLKKPNIFPTFVCMVNLSKFIQTLPQEKQNLTPYLPKSKLFSFAFFIQNMSAKIRRWRKDLKKTLRKKKN